MTFPAEVIAALPRAPGSPDIDDLRDYIVKRIAVGLLPTENPRDFVAKDPDSSAVPYAIDWHETRFWFDADDVTSAHDGVTVLVSSDNLRFKVASLAEVLIDAVQSRTTATPPVSPDYGDAFVMPASPLGAWATFAEHSIALYTGRGWQEVLPNIGKWLFVEDTDNFVRFTATGWQLGEGARVFAANSIPVEAAINFGRYFIVQNRTTTVPPGSPAVSVAFVVGVGATGAWAGHDGEIAIWEGGPSWAFKAPSNGWKVFDLSLNAEFLHDGTTWGPVAGVLIAAPYSFEPGTGSTTLINAFSALYTFSPTVAPTTAHPRRIDDLTVAYKAPNTSVTLEIEYECVVTAWQVESPVGADYIAADTPAVLAILRDAETNAIAWTPCNQVRGTNTWEDPQVVRGRWRVAVPDASTHTYKAVIISAGYNAGGGDKSYAAQGLSRRLFTIKAFL